MDNKTAVEYQAKPEDIVEVGVESQNNANPEKGISKGEERYNKIAESISNAKTKVSGWFNKGAVGLGRLFKRGAIGALNSPENVVAGAKIAGGKIAEEVGYAKDSVVAGATFVGEKVGEGFKSVGDDLNKFDKFTSDKVEQFGVWAGKGAASVYETSTEKYNKAKNFTIEKAGQANDYIKDKAATVEAVGSLLKEKTGEKLNIAKEGIVRNYNGVVEYGKNAVDSAQQRCQKVKENYHNKMNAIKKSILERKAEIQAEKLQKTLSKLEQYKQVEQMGNNLEAVAA